jgi:hypothetical protein
MAVLHWEWPPWRSLLLARAEAREAFDRAEAKAKAKAGGVEGVRASEARALRALEMRKHGNQKA